MGLQVLTGRSGTGKTTTIMNEIVDKLNNNQDEKIILFVPEQMSFQAEYEITKRVQGKTVSNLQVLSFKRLAYRIFLEVGGANKTFISDVAIHMMLRKIIADHQSQFKVYHRLSPSHSFISMVYEIIKELKSYTISEERLASMMASDDLDPQLHDKLHDLGIIYNALMTKYADELLDNEDFYSELAKRLSASDEIKHSLIYIDGYHGFTGVELDVLVELAQNAKNVQLLLTIDNLETNDFHEPDHLFHPVYRMAHNLFARCHEQAIPVEIIKHFTDQKRFKASELAFLEANFEKPTHQYKGEVNHLHIHECMSPKGEVHQAARLIYNHL